MMISQMERKKWINKRNPKNSTGLNNYNNKYEWWKSIRDEELIKSFSVEPAASALGESCGFGS